MAFPQVAATNNGVNSSNDTNHTVNLPAGILAGNLLIVIFCHDDDAENVTFPEGWTKFFDTDQAAMGLTIAWRKADGEEGASITVTTASSEKSAHISYRITDAIDPTSQPPEASTGVTGENENPDPDSLTPTGGAKDYLWLTPLGWDTGMAVEAYPANYGNGERYSSGGAGNCSVAVARRELNAISENPGTFTIDESEEWVACTVAVHPVGVVAAGRSFGYIFG